MYLLTCATNTYVYEFICLCSIAKSLGWTVIVTGSTTKWVGFRTKMETYRDAALKIATEDPDALIVCADAYDVIPLRSPQDYRRIFETFKEDILVSAETNCGANCRKLTTYFNTHSNSSTRPYVNTGLVGGKAKAIHHMWSYLMNSPHTDDQIGVSEYMDLHPSTVALDIDALVFHTSVTRLETIGDVNVIYQSSLNGEGPCFLHLPGTSTFPKQREMFSNSLKVVADRHNLGHMMSTQWAARIIPFNGNVIFYLLLVSLILMTLLSLYLFYRIRFLSR